MADLRYKVVRGTGLSQQRITGKDMEPAPKTPVTFTCPNQHATIIRFAQEAAANQALPLEIVCRQCFEPATIEQAFEDAVQEQPQYMPTIPPKTHRDHLYERRTPEQLEVILEERLTYLRTRRGTLETTP